MGSDHTCNTCGGSWSQCTCPSQFGGFSDDAIYLASQSPYYGPGPFKPKNNDRQTNKKEKIMTEKSLSHRINNLACDLTHEIQAVRMSDSEMIRYIQDKLTSFMLTYQENLLKKDS